MRIIRAFIGLCFLFVAVATVPMWFSTPIAVIYTMVFASIGLWIMGYSVGPSLLLKRARLRYPPKKPFTRADLDRIFQERLEKNAEFREQYQSVESELKNVANEMEHDLLLGKDPNPSFKGDALKRAP
jgi:hypothetical protein